MQITAKTLTPTSPRGGRGALPAPRVVAPLLLAVFVAALRPAARAEFIADGATLNKLTDDGRSIAVSWAYHADLVAFVREVSGGNQTQLFIMKPDGTEPRAVTPVGNPFFVEWSWKSDKISYEFSNTDNDQSQAGVYIYDLATNRSTMVSAPYIQDVLDEDDGPLWSPDDRYVAYRIKPQNSGNSEMWVADVQSGKTWRILADRGSVKEQRWNFYLPPRLSVQVRSRGGSYDLATVDPDGRNFIAITDISAESIRTDEPRWSPTDRWIAFKYDVDMTETERRRHVEDCWIARPDGSEMRNLTNASTPVTEEQLDIEEIYWSWDGRWILAKGDRYDKQGNKIPTYYLIDPVNGGYEIITTCYPREKGTYFDFDSEKWSYDSTKILFLGERFRAKNWGADAEFERPESVLAIYDLKTRKLHDLLVYDQQLDRKEILGKSSRGNIADVSFSPDSRSILLTVAEIVSSEDHVRRPDVYRLDLPDRLISAEASQHIGPPVPAEYAAPSPAPTPEQTTQPPAAVEAKPPQQGLVTETVRPRHMTVQEAVDSLSPQYAQYITLNPSRNVIIFKGPPDVLDAFRHDLKLIDTRAPHVLVDMLAVELSDEANRMLGLDWTYAERHFGFFQPAGNPIQKYPHTGTGEDYRVGFPSGALDSLTTLSGAGQSFYQGVGTLPREFFIRLNTLVKNGQGTILANPRTVATSGTESQIQIQKTLNYFFNEGFDVSGRPIVKKSDISANTEGLITPTVLDDGTIHLVVDVQVGTFTFTREAGLPELTTRESKTQVTVRQGQTLVLGGLRQQEIVTSVTRVPLLSNIPLLGGLFKHQEREVRNSVLTIFITPQVLTDANTTPPWPELNPADYNLVPILNNKE